MSTAESADKGQAITSTAARVPGPVGVIGTVLSIGTSIVQWDANRKEEKRLRAEMARRTASANRVQQEIVARSDLYAATAETVYEQNLATIDEARSEMTAAINNALKTNDKAAADKYRLEMEAIDKTLRATLGVSQQNLEEGLERIATDKLLQEDFLEGDLMVQSRLRGEALANTESSIGMNDKIIRAVSAQIDEIAANGGRPRGLDAAQSQVEADFRDLEADVNRVAAATGATNLDAKKTSLLMNKAKARASTSATYREKGDQALSQLSATAAGATSNQTNLARERLALGTPTEGRERMDFQDKFRGQEQALEQQSARDRLAITAQAGDRATASVSDLASAKQANTSQAGGRFLDLVGKSSGARIAETTKLQSARQVALTGVTGGLSDQADQFLVSARSAAEGAAAAGRSAESGLTNAISGAGKLIDTDVDYNSKKKTNIPTLNTGVGAIVDEDERVLKEKWRAEREEQLMRYRRENQM